jgi:3-phosphoshikimate 1-carboxyvinyltransferase
MQVKGTLYLPGDKSISHRAIMLSSIADGKSTIRNLNDGADLQSTINALKACGAKIDSRNQAIIIEGVDLTNPNEKLDCGNSGTTTRLISGLLSSQKLDFTLVGDSSLSSRPMKRIITPLQKMGCDISSNDNLLPLTINAKEGIRSIDYKIPVASAQVKSCILLAALGGDNPSTIHENILTRNHTEVMLKNMGATISFIDKSINIHPLKNKLNPINITIPSDPSSAAFFAAMAVINDNSELTLNNVLLNKTRIGFIDVLKKMNCNLAMGNKQLNNGEKTGDITFSTSDLTSVEVESEIIPSIIDEIPILSVVAAYSNGITIFRNIEELKYKECDRLHAIIHNLNAFGINAYEKDNSLFVEGGKPDNLAEITTFHDHRIAMAFTILSLTSFGKYHLDNKDCIDISLPNFFNLIKRVAE